MRVDPYCYTPLTSSAPPLFVIEFLHRVVDVLTDYLGDCTEAKIKDHYVIVYEVSRGERGRMKEGKGEEEEERGEGEGEGR